VFPPHRDIHQTYDLKGSTVGREFDEAKLKDNPKGPLKDLNWINRGMNLQFGPRKKNLLMSQLKKDVEVCSFKMILTLVIVVVEHYGLFFTNWDTRPCPWKLREHSWDDFVCIPTQSLASSNAFEEGKGRSF
jgi:Phosphatidylinositol-4-phosphate 5-Kinase